MYDFYIIVLLYVVWESRSKYFLYKISLNQQKETMTKHVNDKEPHAQLQESCTLPDRLLMSQLWLLISLLTNVWEAKVNAVHKLEVT